MMNNKAWLIVFVVFLAKLAKPVEGKTADKIGCPCGFVGENCTERGFQYNGQVYTGNVSYPPDICENVWFCQVELEDVDVPTVSCYCDIGYDGDTCEDKVVPSLLNLVGAGLVLPIVGFVVSWMFLKKYDDGCDSACIENCIEGVGSRKVVLGYRVVCFLMVLGLQLYQYSQIEWTEERFGSLFRAYTVVNFHLVILYFAFAVYISIRQEKSKAWAVHWFHIFQEVELPNSLLVTMVTWVILYPMVAEEAPEILLNVESYFQHIVNFLVMFGDALLVNTYFTNIRVLHPIMFGSVYIVWHNSIMLLEMLQGLEHKPTYPFLNTSAKNPYFVLYLVGLTIVGMAFYFLVGKFLQWKHKTTRSDIINNKLDV